MTVGSAAADSTGEMTPAPPATQRRTRAREVSSRFMTPLIRPNSIPNPSIFPRSKSVNRRLKIDENHDPNTNRSLDEAPDSILSRKQGKQNFKENIRVSSRPDTPIAIGSSTTDRRVVPSRYRQVSNTPIYRSKSLNSSSSGCTAVTAAARLIEEITSDVEKKKKPPLNRGSSSCPNSPRNVVDTRSSMSDMDKWFAEKKNSHNRGKVSSSDCARNSLNLSSSAKVVGVSVPRPPSSGLDVKKGRNHQEDVHSLKMLSNRYLQWRFANAKAEEACRVQEQEAERQLYSLGCKISDMRDNVNKKRKELAALRGIKTLTTVVEDQMPYLDEWSALEEDYSTSPSGTTNALVSSSARLPVSGEVRADPKELGEAMSSAVKVVESIGSHIQQFMQKAEEMDTSVSEVARMAGGERTLIEECGDLLSKTHLSQVKECSLRGIIMQLHAHQTQK